MAIPATAFPLPVELILRYPDETVAMQERWILHSPVELRKLALFLDSLKPGYLQEKGKLSTTASPVYAWRASGQPLHLEQAVLYRSKRHFRDVCQLPSFVETRARQILAPEGSTIPRDVPLHTANGWIWVEHAAISPRIIKTPLTT